LPLMAQTPVWDCPNQARGGTRSTSSGPVGVVTVRLSPRVCEVRFAPIKPGAAPARLRAARFRLRRGFVYPAGWSSGRSARPPAPARLTRLRAGRSLSSRCGGLSHHCPKWLRFAAAC
jgi:hypothetical protein